MNISNKSFVNQEIKWIETEQQLEQACAVWSRCKLLSVDTEFMRSRTYFPAAGLFQVNDTRTNYLIDPTTIENFSSFKEVLLNPDVIIVLHSCSEDLEVFQHALGVIPANLFDTQIAAAMLGYGYSVGFGNLCQSMFNIELPKSETRSNWLQRPLSDAQLVYAAIDVEYLTAITVRLIKEAQNLGRLSWVKEECDKLVNSFAESQDIELAWQRNKSAWKLDELELLRFQKLSLWREQKAQQRDVPRNRIVKDRSLLELAQQAPTELAEFKQIEGFSQRIIRGDGEELLSLLEQANSTASDQLPQRLPRPFSSSLKEKIKKVKQKVQAKADQENIASEILVRNKEYDELVRNFQAGSEKLLPEGILGWRQGVIGDLLLEETKKTCNF